jgi:hypothetical protein
MRTTVKPWHIALALMALVGLIVALWPIGLGRDYMNHLARTYIQANLGSDLALQQYYAVSFDIIPDLTMDLIIPWLSKIIGIYSAGAVTIWIAFILPPLAGIALAKTLHGRVTWLSLLGFLAVFNSNMDWGFVNYTASSGLALLSFVLWIRMRPGWQRTAVFLPLGLVLVINHALAFLMFGFLAFVWEVVSFAKGDRGALTSFIKQCACLDLTAMLGGLGFLFLSMQSVSDLPQDIGPLYDLPMKASALFSAVQFGNVFVAASLTVALIGFFWLALRQGWITFAEKTGWLCAAFLALVIIMPTAVFGIWGLHLRFTAPLLIIVAACAVPSERFTAQSQAICTGIFGALMAASYANGAAQLANTDNQANQLREVVADLPEGSKVLSVYSDPSAASAFSAHAVSLAVIERNAFVPNLFTNTSPVDITPDMVDLHMPQSAPILAANLAGLAKRPRTESENGFWSPYFARDWPAQWNYLMLFEGETATRLDGLPVCEIAMAATVRLYKTGSCD